jgi:16S rRNA (uracil1498-N3)-methyltransferase
MDLIVRQATEAGVSLILPFVAQRSVSRPDSGSDTLAKRDRWARIVREARQQSGSDLATVVTEPMTLDGALAAWRDYTGQCSSPVGIFLHQDPLAQGTFHGYLGVGPDALALAVGPEGGFSPLEVEQLVSTRFLPALLGANVLRTETAAIFALAAVHAILLEKASWIPKTPDSPA